MNNSTMLKDVGTDDTGASVSSTTLDSIAGSLPSVDHYAPMELELDSNSPDPLHRQIEVLLRQMIQRPEYQAGKVLPNEVSLAERLKVSRNTVRAAIMRLESEGLVERKTKRGTRVKRAPTQIPLDAWYSFSKEMKKQGIQVTNFELSVSRQQLPDEAAVALNVPAGTTAFCLRRVRGWSDEPVLVSISWFHPSLGITGDEDFRRPLYEVIFEASKRVPASSREQITAYQSDAAVAAALDIPLGHPSLRRVRTTFDEQGQPLEYNVNFYHTDRYILSLDLKIDPGKLGR